nr:unnamed protein product [Spirometra erinaceieuropaei]
MTIHPNKNAVVTSTEGRLRFQSESVTIIPSDDEVQTTGLLSISESSVHFKMLRVFCSRTMHKIPLDVWTIEITNDCNVRIRPLAWRAVNQGHVEVRIVWHFQVTTAYFTINVPKWGRLNPEVVDAISYKYRNPPFVRFGSFGEAEN